MHSYTWCFDVVQWGQCNRRLHGSKCSSCLGQVRRSDMGWNFLNMKRRTLISTVSLQSARKVVLDAELVQSVCVSWKSLRFDQEKVV